MGVRYNVEKLSLRNPNSISPATLRVIRRTVPSLGTAAGSEGNWTLEDLDSPRSFSTAVLLGIVNPSMQKIPPAICRHVINISNWVFEILGDPPSSLPPLPDRVYRGAHFRTLSKAVGADGVARLGLLRLISLICEFSNVQKPEGNGRLKTRKLNL